MKRLIVIAVLVCGAWAAPVPDLPLSVYNITSFGAAGDGKTNDAAAIQRAVDECSRKGGGTVYVPAGSFLTGTILLRSNITLYISPGATLWGSRNLKDFQPPHLIYAKDAQNVTIEGGGSVDGNGDAFWEPDFRPKKRPADYIEFDNCRHVRIEDLHLRNLPGWGIRPSQCDDVVIRGISIINDMRSPNTDGIDPDSSRNVMISDCYIETGDDAICLKSANPAARGRGPEALPTENVTVTNCVLTSDDSAIKLGTGSYGGFRNCTFSNCVISGSRYGLAMFIKDGGPVEGIAFSNITIDTSVAHYNKVTNSNRQWIEYPIIVDLEKRTPESRVSRVRDVLFSNIRIQSKGRVLVAGMPEQKLENIRLDGVSMRVTGFEDVEKQHKPRGVKDQPNAPRANDYASVTAAMAFANIHGLDLHGVRLIWDEEAVPPRDRHALYIGRSEDIVLSDFSGLPSGRKLAAIGLEKVQRIMITGSHLGGVAPAFLGLAGTPMTEVVLSGNDLGKTPISGEGRVYVHLP